MGSVYPGIIIIIIMAHPVVVDDELGASPFFLRSLWIQFRKVSHQAKRMPTLEINFTFSFVLKTLQNVV